MVLKESHIYDHFFHSQAFFESLTFSPAFRSIEGDLGACDATCGVGREEIGLIKRRGVEAWKREA